MKKKVVVLTGAGMSAESGIATFRDSGGLWNEYRVEDVATPEGFGRNPQLVLDFYNHRRRELLKSSANKGHRLLAELEKDFDVRIITQNVDNLHEQAGSTQVLHLHGELMKVQSTRNPELVYELSPENIEVNVGDTAEDGGQLRPSIVWFGEAVPMIEPAINLASQAEVFVVIGTSLNVYPAAGLLHYVPQGVPVYLIDPQEVSFPRSGITFIRQGASQGVETLAKILKEKEDNQ